MLTTETSKHRKRLMPLLLYDLDRDGLSEIILGGLSRIYRNLGNGKFRAEPLASTDLDMFDAAILADFTGDGYVDLVYVDQERKPMLLAGNREGRFPGTPTQCATVELELPKSFTAADIDADGDLDLFIGQYKFPYVEGSMPTPFYDANDGYPAMLLENDGHGAFRDITEKAGLAKKRHRRTFSSSLVDFDDDGDQDLITVNDFCGVDLYTNDGRGKFTDVTDQLGDDRHLFGMAHTFADYNLDGRLDMYGIGMDSTTARRLHQMGIGRARQARHYRQAHEDGLRQSHAAGRRPERPPRLRPIANERPGRPHRLVLGHRRRPTSTTTATATSLSSTVTTAASRPKTTAPSTGATTFTRVRQRQTRKHQNSSASRSASCTEVKSPGTDSKTTYCG